MGRRRFGQTSRRLTDRLVGSIGALALLVATMFVCPPMSGRPMAMGGMAQTGMTSHGMMHHTGMSSAHRGVQQHANSPSESAHSVPAHRSHNMPPCAHCTGQVLACTVAGRVTFVSAMAMTAVVPPVVVRSVVVQEPESTPVMVVAGTPPPLPDIFAQKQSLLI